MHRGDARKPKVEELLLLNEKCIKNLFCSFLGWFTRGWVNFFALTIVQKEAAKEGIIVGRAKFFFYYRAEFLHVSCVEIHARRPIKPNEINFLVAEKWILKLCFRPGRRVMKWNLFRERKNFSVEWVAGVEELFVSSWKLELIKWTFSMPWKLSRNFSTSKQQWQRNWDFDRIEIVFAKLKAIKWEVIK